VGKNKKYFDEKLQEARSKHDKVQYLRRKQEEDDAKKRMADFLQWFHEQEDEDEDR
jgi:ribonuclease HI